MALKDEVSVAEIQRMLDEGRTRREVAALLDISYNSLLHYIGPDPKRKPYTRRERPVAEAPKAVPTIVSIEPIVKEPVSVPVIAPPVAQSPVAQPPVQKTRSGFKRDIVHKETLHGEYAEYTIDIVNNTVTIDAFVATGCPMTAETFMMVTREFMAIYREVSTQ